jgi:endonuclease YncB( thermonuclease family)
MRVVRFTFLIAAALAAFVVHADFSGRVVAVQDGDTLTVLDADRHQHRVRLAGIDAPEKRQAFGQRAKLALSNCAFGADVTVQGKKTDRYGRLVGKVLNGDVDCNLNQLQLGLAWHYKRYEREQSRSDAASYAQAEINARERRAGLWSEPTAVAPWQFRRGAFESLHHSTLDLEPRARRPNSEF